jgi:putative copper resistance protein D
MVADGVGGSLREALEPAVISAYVGEVEQARALLYTALIALAVALLTPGTRGSGSATAVLAGALLALVLPSVYGHANTGHARGASVFAAPVIGVHVAAMSVWIGGLVVLFLLVRRDGAAVTASLPRFSALALGCFLAVGVSGAVSAATRVKTTNALLETSYGRVILLKVALFVLLGGLGYLQRRRVMGRLLELGTSAVFRRIAACEMLLMVVTVAVAVALSRTPPPGA